MSLRFWERLSRKTAKTPALSQEEPTARRYLDALRQMGGESLFLLNAAGEALWMNNAARKLIPPEAESAPRLTSIAGSHEPLALARQALADDDPHERQFSVGGNHYLAVARRASQRPPLVGLTISDVTELLRLGRARRDFLANVSHDLRTPIAAIQLMVETLRTGVADDARRQQLLNSITQQTNSLQQLAQEMLDLSMIESGRMPFKLVETPLAAVLTPISQRMAAQAEHKDVKLILRPLPDVHVWADVNQVQRALQNLLHNAIKYTPAGGNIIISSEVGDEEVTVIVADTGVGIAAKDQEQVFERFYKANRGRSDEGTGLGLAITRHIIKGHGGRIWVESQLGQGATFFFTLPRV